MGEEVLTQGVAKQCPIYWDCPLNIGGLEPDSITKLFDEDLVQLLQPLALASDNGRAFKKNRITGPLFFGKLTDQVEQRVRNLKIFLRQVDLISRQQKNLEPILRFEALGGDSHNGGRRPLLLQFNHRPMVLKFADPRPHQLLCELLSALSGGIGVDLRPPSVLADVNHQWYLMPFLDSGVSEDMQMANACMYALGALTAVAYALRFVDLHLENIVISDGKPVIIDPECIFYNFVPDVPVDRLLSTGLLSHNPSLSALRGGDVSQQSFIQLDVHQRLDGKFDYNKPVQAFHNRFIAKDNVRADPANYRSELLGGFVNAYLWLIKYSDEVSDILNKWVQDDFRIRYLVRKTRLYATVMHMLNLPMSWSYEAWRDHIFSQLRRSGHFPQTLSEQTIQAECHDLENRDIPHFWLVAGEPVIQHATGRCQGISWKRPVLAQARLDVKRLCRSDLTLQTDILMNFLDKNLDGSINPNGQ